ncbi:MAG TPA: 50S ribosomal protein L17 [Chthonomonas sp.]|jgi:large subunit ribosomal protein L17|nr:50S ribosomal protein L17 [Chthonomonas sp.]HLH81172.1 50S ribosomal protein L17 [Chthonomonas sp.]
MRHRKAYRKFGLPSDQRRALLKSLTRSLLLHDRIVTTETRAKEVRAIVEKLVTIAREGGPDAPIEKRLHARRLVRRFIDSNIDEFVRDTEHRGPKGGATIARNPYYVIPRLFDEIAPRYVGRNGGYTRISKIGFRRGDGAPLVVLEFVEGLPTATSTEAAAPAQEGRRGLLGLGRRRK